MVSAWLRAALLGASLAVQPATVVPAAQRTQAAQNLTSQAAAAAASSGCTGASDCRVGQYCDFRHVCYNCSYLSAKCDAVDLDCCSDVFVSRCPSDPLHCHRRVPPIVGCGSPAAPGGSAAACVAALTTACGAERPDVFKCAQCAGAHQAQLHAAGCSNDNISLWCSTGGGDSTSSSSGGSGGSRGGESPSKSSAPLSQFFCGSRIFTDEMRVTLHDWLDDWPPHQAEQPEQAVRAKPPPPPPPQQQQQQQQQQPPVEQPPVEQQWELCFSSFEHGVSSASSLRLFHAQCDQYNTTLVVFNNSFGIFGGYVSTVQCRTVQYSAVQDSTVH
jgi:hypothetical protein